MENLKSQTKDGKVPQSLRTAEATITSRMGGVQEGGGDTRIQMPSHSVRIMVRLPGGIWEQGGLECLVGSWNPRGDMGITGKYSSCLLSVVAVFYQVTMNSELGNTKPLLLGEIQG